jgi:hypothetical protein
VSNLRKTTATTTWPTLLVLAALASSAAAQSTQPVWWPPLSLYGRPVAQPFFDFPNWARYSYCRPAPLAWGYDPYVSYGPCDCAPGYSTINCPGNFVAHRPNNWYFTADFAPTTVDFQNTILVSQTVSAAGVAGADALSTANLQPDFDAGARFTIGRRIFGCYRLEGTYWGSYNWVDYASAAPGTPGTTLNSLLSGGFGNPIVPALDNNTYVAIENRTQMNSAELNLLYWIDMPPGPYDVSLLVGARYLDIRDQFNFFSSNPTQTNALQVNSTNPLWCLQIGLVHDVLVSSRMWANFTMKGGIASDHATLVNAYTTTPAGGVATPHPGAATQNRTAFLGDLQLTANLQITPWLVGRIGYQALFVDGIAVAADNVQTNNQLLSAGFAQINDRSNAVFHGPLIGLMGNW